MPKLNIAVVTGTRAEYGLLCGLMHAIKKDADLELQLIVTGMHLSPEFGLTYQLIEDDGFEIAAKVEMLMSSDTATGIAKSIGLGVIGFADTLAKLEPDLIILLGDRFESLAVAQTALAHKIPLAHIHGGELSEGAIDDAIRHAITKMSHLHFVAAEPYKKRIIQMGENPKNVFNVGAPGLERITKIPLLNRVSWENKMHWQLGELNFLVTYHPVTLEIENNMESLHALFSALAQFPQAKIIFTKANADEAGRYINQQIDQYVMEHPQKAIAFTNLGDVNYLSLLQHVDVVIGNSSSGLIEVPFFKKPTVNIGNRQAKRLRAATVIDCENNGNAISAAIHQALSNDFKITLAHSLSPYQQANTVEKILKVIKEINIKSLIKKEFHDWNIAYE